MNIDHIDFISIDTGGNELETLEGFDLLKWKVKLLVVQNNFDEPYIKNYLSKFGYEFKERHGVNDFFEFIENINSKIELKEEIEEILKI
jgi:hypothetical protein